MTAPLAAVERRLVVHLGSVAGMPPQLGSVMTRRVRERVGTLEFGMRAATFLLATRPGIRIPETLRERVVGGLVSAMIRVPGDLLDFLGHEEGQSACRDLLRT